MPQASTIQTAFNAGELTPHLEGRVDYDKYGQGCKTLTNFIPLVQGPIRRRPGTRFLKEVKTSANSDTRLLRFVFSRTQSYILEFGSTNATTGYIRFFTDHGVIVSTGSTPYEVTTPYGSSDLIDSDGRLMLKYVQSGDVIYICHPSYAPRKLTRIADNNWTLSIMEFEAPPFDDDNTTSTTMLVDGYTGSIHIKSSTSTFTSDHLGAYIRLGQRYATTVQSWQTSAAILTGNRRRYDGKNFIATTTGTTGTISPIHEEGETTDGGVTWRYTDNGYGYAKITEIVSGTEVHATVISEIPFLGGTVLGTDSLTTKWSFNSWNEINGYPTVCTFFRNRLAFAMGERLWFSQVADYENFWDFDKSGKVVADCAIDIEIQGDDISDIQWMNSGRVLTIGTTSAEFTIQETSTSSAFSPTNIRALQESTYGSDATGALKVGNTILFVQKGGTIVRELSYDTVSEASPSRSMSILSDHITDSGIIDAVWCPSNGMILWTTTKDGVLTGLTFDKEQNVFAWHKHNIGDGIIECVESIPSPDGTYDELYMIVQRTINSNTKRYIEYLDKNFSRDADIDEPYFVDCGLTYDGYNSGSTTMKFTGASYLAGAIVTITASVSTFVAGDVGDAIVLYDSDGIPYTADIITYTSGTSVLGTLSKSLVSALQDTTTTDWSFAKISLSGLSHLEGATVDILSDGSPNTQKVVTGGAVTLDSTGSYVHIGLPCPCYFESMQMNAGSANGTAQGKVKRIHSCTFRFDMTVGGKVGPNFDNLDEIQFRDSSNNMNEAVPFFTGDKKIQWPSGYEENARICYANTQPLAVELVAIMPELQTHG